MISKIVFSPPDKQNQMMPNTFIQYLFKSEEHEIGNVKPHANSKKNSSYRRILPSTHQRLKESFNTKSTTVKQALDAVHCSVGDEQKK